VRESVFYDSNLLGGEKDSRGIDEQIEGMLCHGMRMIWVVLRNVSIEKDEIVVSLTKQLKFEFIIDLDDRVDPVHFKL